MKLCNYVVLFGTFVLLFGIGYNIGHQQGIGEESLECEQKLMAHMCSACNTLPPTDKEMFFYQSDGRWHIIIPRTNQTNRSIYDEYIWNDTGWIIPEYERTQPYLTGTVNTNSYNDSVTDVWYNITDLFYENNISSDVSTNQTLPDGTYEYHWNGTGWYTDGQHIRLPGVR